MTAATGNGHFFVLCAPSGTGKSTLVRRLMREFPNLRFSVSCTTRAPREGERNGRDYHFISHDEFQSMRSAEKFVEWAEVHGNFYATPMEEVRKKLDAGFDLLFDIDVQGAEQIRERMPHGCYVFLLPPSRDALRKRLVNRGTDTPEVIEKRLANARTELEKAHKFNYLIVNDDLDTAYRQLRAVYLSCKLTPEVNPELIPSIMNSWS
jgi:guanylate kinase